jgi:hypothetical protein
MAQLVQVKNKGLYTSPNEFSSVPDGSLLRANNCIITVDNIIESRRGNDRVAQLPLADDRFSRLEVYQDNIVATWSNGKVGYKSGSAFVAVSGTYNDSSSTLARRRFLSAASCLFFTTSAGVYKLDAYNGTPVLAGMFKGLDLSLALTGAAGFISNNNQVAYRIVFGRRDAQNNLLLGAPSGRAVVINSSGGSRDCVVTFTLPTGITTSDFYQVYRSENSGGVSVEPDDELGLVYENNPTAGEITAGSVTFTDSTTDDLRGATIYTALSQEGIQQSNERPPMCDDMEEFYGSTVYANTASKQRKSITLLSASLFAIDDTITIAGVTYTAKAAETIASASVPAIHGRHSSAEHLRHGMLASPRHQPLHRQHRRLCLLHVRARRPPRADPHRGARTGCRGFRYHRERARHGLESGPPDVGNDRIVVKRRLPERHHDFQDRQERGGPAAQHPPRRECEHRNPSRQKAPQLALHLQGARGNLPDDGDFARQLPDRATR